MRVKSGSVIGEINVTPLVDVILVLLVVFIITAPMIIPGVDVDLPVASTPSSNQTNTDVIVSITRGGEIYMQDSLVKLQDLDKEIQKNTEDKDARIFIRGDRDAPYEIIVKTLAHLKGSGFMKISLVTDT